MWVSQQGVPPLKSVTGCYENTVRLASLVHTLSLSVCTHATPFNNVICSHSSTFIGNINTWKLHFISDRKGKKLLPALLLGINVCNRYENGSPPDGI